MKTVFLSFQFHEPDRPLVELVERLLESHRIEVVTGRRLGGNQLTPEIKKRISDSDGLVALCTRRQERGAGWTTSDWVVKEYQFARSAKKPSIAMLEAGVKPTQFGREFHKHEHLAFERGRSAEAVLALSETVAKWKQVPIRALVLPAKISDLVARYGSKVGCRYRLRLEGREGGWQKADIVPGPGGACAYLKADDGQQMVQLEVSHAGRRWHSLYTQQWVHIEMKPGRA